VEGGPEVGAVDYGVPRGLGVVEVFATRAVQFYRGGVGDVGLAHGQERLRVAHYAGAFAEVGFLEFLELESVSAGLVWEVKVRNLGGSVPFSIALVL
jgi:hypothetical protein